MVAIAVRDEDGGRHGGSDRRGERVAMLAAGGGSRAKEEEAGNGSSGKISPVGLVVTSEAPRGEGVRGWG